MSSLETLAEIGKIAGGVVAAMTVMKTVTGWWHTGPGRRRAWAKDFAKLAPHVRPEYVEALFGAPAFELQAAAQSPDMDEGTGKVVWQDQPPLIERVWPLAQDGYLTTWSESSGLVAYSLTTARRGFKPKIRIGTRWKDDGTQFTVKLGRTRLHEVSDGLGCPSPQEVVSWVGARRFEYYETYYFGNPGMYQTWACGVSNAGYRAGEAGGLDRFGADDSAFIWGSDCEQQLTAAQRARLDEFRRDAVVNSVMIRGLSALRILPALPRSGPDIDIVRTLAKPPGLIARYRHRRWLRELEATEPRRRLPWLPRPRRRRVERDEGVEATSGSQPPSA